MSKDLLVVFWYEKNGKFGYGNAIFNGINEKIDMDDYDEIIEKIEKENHFKNVVILNLIYIKEGRKKDE